MTKLIVGRISFGLATLLLISMLLFFGADYLPGDVATAILGQQATPEAIAVFRQELGLDQPAWNRYMDWLTSAVHGDFGVSLASGRPISEDVVPRIWSTLALAGIAAAISVPLAMTLGILAVIHEGSLFDRVVTVSSLSLISVPEFLVSYILIIVFSVQLGWLPSLSVLSVTSGFLDRVISVILPASTLILIVLAHMVRMTRASLQAIMDEPYVEMAFLKGLRRRTVVLNHVYRNAAAPILAVTTLNLGYLVVGVVIVEVVFVYPGVGQLMVDAVSKRDLPLVQACGLVFASTYILLNTVSDVIAILINPRLRLQS